MKVKYLDKTPLIMIPELFNIVNSDDFKQTVSFLHGEGHGNVILDFSEVTVIDSSALGKIILAQKMLKDSGGGLKIIHVTSKRVLDLFRSIFLHHEIEIEGLS